MRWLNSTTDSMDMNLSKLQEVVEDRGASTPPLVVQSIGSQNQTQLSCLGCLYLLLLLQKLAGSLSLWFQLLTLSQSQSAGVSDLDSAAGTRGQKIHSFHTEFQHKFAWSSWQGSWQVLLFIYSLHVKLSLELCLVFRNFIQRPGQVAHEVGTGGFR